MDEVSKTSDLALSADGERDLSEVVLNERTMDGLGDDGGLFLLDRGGESGGVRGGESMPPVLMLVRSRHEAEGEGRSGIPLFNLLGGDRGPLIPVVLRYDSSQDESLAVNPRAWALVEPVPSTGLVLLGGVGGGVGGLEAS